MRDDYKIISFEKSQDRRLAVRVSAFLRARFGRKISHSVRVDAVGGVIYLRGEIPDRGIGETIRKTVKDLPGVKDVISELQVPGVS